MESKWMATNSTNTQMWMNAMDFGNNPKIVEITIPKSALDNLYFQPNLDNIGPTFCSDINYLNQVLKFIK